MRLMLATTLSLLSLAQSTPACSISRDWRPPTVEAALNQAEVVIHAKVTAVKQEGGVSLATVSVEQVLKGKYSGHLVETGGGGACGIGTFTVGRSYVFFFEQRGTWYVTGLLQPRSTNGGESRLLDANEVIPAFNALSKRDRWTPGVWVPEAQWDLPPYKTSLSTVRLLNERERQYRSQQR
ncbi:hypothetical protein ACS5PN_30210 [Roseateles sp. NT4]|uniref:hypothetical protein n=1 Tax=Roseateles sp. NT4 TaxID=3453715 RepID=UPI003EEB487E